MTTPNPKIKICFAGTDEFAALALKRLLENDQFAINLIITPPDNRQGRHQNFIPCPVKKLALEHHLQISHDLKTTLENSLDFLIVASYGYILPQEILNHPRYSSLNIHPSLIKMTSKLDAGPIYSFSEFAINSDHNAQTLRHDLAILGGELTSQSLLGIIDGSIESIPQESQRASYCAKINRLSGQIKWKKDTAQTIEQKIKAYYPWPGVFTHFNNKILKIHAGSTKSGKTKHPGLIQKINPNTIAIETKNGFFIPKIVQIEGKKAMPIEIFIQGYRNFVDTPLT